MASYNDLTNKPQINNVTLLEGAYEVIHYGGVKIIDSPTTIIEQDLIPIFTHNAGELDCSSVSISELLTTSNLIHESGSLSFNVLTTQSKYVDFTRMKNVWFWSVLPTQVMTSQAYSRPYQAVLSDTGTNTRITVTTKAAVVTTPHTFNIYIIGEPY